MSDDVLVGVEAPTRGLEVSVDDDVGGFAVVTRALGGSAGMLGLEEPTRVLLWSEAGLVVGRLPGKILGVRLDAA